MKYPNYSKHDAVYLLNVAEDSEGNIIASGSHLYRTTSMEDVILIKTNRDCCVENIECTDRVVTASEDIELISLEEVPTIYPNPAAHYFTVKGQLADYDEMLLESLTGQQKFFGKIQSGHYNTDNLANGLYFVKWTKNGKCIYVAKLVIAK